MTTYVNSSHHPNLAPLSELLDNWGVDLEGIKATA